MMKRKNIAIIGAPFEGSGTRPEVENPAEAIRQAGLNDALQSHGLTTESLGDITIPEFENIQDKKTQILNLNAWKAISLQLSEKISQINDSDTFTIVLGGDCGITLGIVGAYTKKNKRIGLVYLDGHTDFHSPKNAPLGEPAYLPLWVLTGKEPSLTKEMYGVAEMIGEDDIALYGFREPESIEQSSITAFSASKMKEIGIAESFKRGVQPLVDRDLDLWIHFDVDVLDPIDMKAVLCPESGGLLLKDTEEFLKMIIDTDRAVGISLGCYHPNLDKDGTAAKKLVDLLVRVLS